ncbi:MAG TPA: hypothetical protein ENJ89_00855 [Caldithrix abyssi]|uniref:Uncharacterized protein n=1 Tax=Caldithrix abyssi TaxID=187145 RepID=A0A7V5UDT0_CALAY|nr:hypothetical protein [Caldithrix abyssi]
MFLFENWEISEVLDDIVLGRGVKRSVHDLQFDQNIYTELFVERLQLYKYRPMPIKDIPIEVGKRVPAFLIDGKTAIFGYVFWEVFSDKRKRKLWGSVVRNEKGDWKYVLPGNSSRIVFVNLDQSEEVDLYYLS